MFEQLLTIARNTFTQSIRQPICAVIVLSGALLLVFNAIWSAYTFENDNKLMIDAGLSTVLLAGLFLAAFTATGVISHEIERRTVLTVVSKPVPRPVFVLGKFLGVAGALLLASWILCVVLLLTVRHKVMTTAADAFDQPVLCFGIAAALLAGAGAALGNYFYRWVFTSSLLLSLGALLTVAWGLVLLFSKTWELQSPAVDFNPQIMLALMMIFESVLILTAVAIAASTRLGQVMTLLTCAAVFLLSLTTQYMNMKASYAFADSATRTAGVVTVYGIVKTLYFLLPDGQFFYLGDALTQDHDFSMTYVVKVSAYGVLYITAVLSVAVAMFQSREVG